MHSMMLLSELYSEEAGPPFLLPVPKKVRLFVTKEALSDLPLAHLAKYWPKPPFLQVMSVPRV